MCSAVNSAFLLQEMLLPFDHTLPSSQRTFLLSGTGIPEQSMHQGDFGRTLGTGSPIFGFKEFKPGKTALHFHEKNMSNS